MTWLVPEFRERDIRSPDFDPALCILGAGFDGPPLLMRQLERVLANARQLERISRAGKFKGLCECPQLGRRGIRGGFNEVDTVLHWHPGNTDSASQAPSLPNISGKFRCHGQSSHASGAPEKGRSALNGVEAMDAMANMMREHIPRSSLTALLQAHSPHLGASKPPIAV